jgi:hypothetical protein
MPRRTDATDGTSRRKPHTVPASPRTTRRSSAGVDHEDAPPQQRAGLGGLLRGPGAVLGGLSGIDGAGRSLDRLSRAADRGAAFLERMEDELGWDRAILLIERLETLVALLEGRGVLAERLGHLVHAVEGIDASLGEIEAMVADLHQHLMPPPSPAPRRRR